MGSSTCGAAGFGFILMVKLIWVLQPSAFLMIRVPEWVPVAALKGTSKGIFPDGNG